MKTLTYLANIKPYKNQTMAIRVLELLCYKYNYNDVELNLVGRDDGNMQELKELALALRLPVIFTGLVTDPQPILESTDIYIHCSNEEGCSNAILEAMKAGLPVVCTDVGGNKELIINEEGGFLVPRNDHTLMAHYIDVLFTFQTARTNFGAYNKKRVQKLFTIPQMVTAYMEIYNV